MWQDVRGVVREVLLPWYNAYRFLVQVGYVHMCVSVHAMPPASWSRWGMYICVYLYMQCLPLLGPGERSAPNSSTPEVMYPLVMYPLSPQAFPFVCVRALS